VTYAGRTAGVIATIPATTTTTADDGETGEGDLVRHDVEHLVGGAGADVLSGLDGGDTLDGGTGADAITGGGGLDLLTYGSRTATQPVTVVLDGTPTSGDTSAAALDGPAGARDSVAGDVEQVTGGAGNDVLTAGLLATTLTGGGGNDVLTGGPLADRLDGGTGADKLFGMDGNDVLRARDATSDLVLDCDGGQAPGATDSVDYDLRDAAPVNCETKTPH
jgi:Ca2+-binding RTX toxin-like protein